MQKIKYIVNEKESGLEIQLILAVCERQTAISVIRDTIKTLKEDEAVRFQNGLRIVKEYRVHPEDFDLAVRGKKHRRRPVLVVIYKDVEREFVTGNYRRGF